MKFLNRIIGLVARRLNVPPLAVEMVGIANSLSGLGRETLPSELIPLNAIQLSRGLLNFAVIQTLHGWVLPFWATRQYDINDPAFVPRSHLGLSMNVTHRNWTGIGSPDSNAFGVVDERGLVMPFKHGWSIDVWLKVGDAILFPSRAESATQRAVDQTPIIETTFQYEGLSLTVSAWMVSRVLHYQVQLVNRSDSAVQAIFGIAVRPFNGEGIGLTSKIECDRSRSTLMVNSSHVLGFSERPVTVRFGNHRDGDTALKFGTQESGTSVLLTECPVGMANAVAEFHAELDPGGIRSLDLRCTPRSETRVATRTREESVAVWNAIRQQGIRLTCPDPQTQSLFDSSVMTLLLLSSGGTITPGPFTYNQFWFRDASSMIVALERTGFHDRAKAMITQFPKLQDRKGYFRSQQGEWDSNGQALWATFVHVFTTGDKELFENMFESLKLGAEWIARQRNTAVGKNHVRGLLPPGLSAEHLGLADQYYWDDFWGLAGLQAWKSMLAFAERRDLLPDAQAMYESFRKVLTETVLAGRLANGGIITAGPTRKPDAGSIGSVAGLYPLQLYAPGVYDETLTALSEVHSKDGLFYQDFIHSGFNLYLSLHIAHAYLFAGNTKKFWGGIKAVSNMASMTGTWPEAVHPRTGGGVMGDGHHGWAAAEYVLALRDAFVMERRDPLSGKEWIEFLAGVPASWLMSAGGCSLFEVPVFGGIASVRVEQGKGSFMLHIQVEQHSSVLPPTVRLIIPFPNAVVRVVKGSVIVIEYHEESTACEINQGIFQAEVFP